MGSMRSAAYGSRPRRGPYTLWLSALIAASVSVTACGAPPGHGGADSRPGGAKAPRALTLERRGAQALDIVEITGGKDRKVTAPEDGRVGWPAAATAPGARSVVVLTGRAGTTDHPGPLHGLIRAVVGDKAKITHRDGTTTSFTIGRIQMISRDLPTVAEAAQGAQGRELRVIALTGSGKDGGEDRGRSREKDGEDSGAEGRGAVSEQVGLLVSATVSR
ncbi:hypothetical protein CRV15_35085 (plasmid) [Streptomyces clavuligerus]|uniref:Lipoprotein n=2 Tax=Streptomyces clavuligerus TaxID=1901 RepID=D5SLX3_STRCL|nr:Hypothetical protein SCLAV_p1434 [Streptomyces clavuligerus]QCS10745.1 hypothetical protein CRV15_35085 [Streptomyces clavuligerus]